MCAVGAKTVINEKAQPNIWSFKQTPIVIPSTNFEKLEDSNQISERSNQEKESPYIATILLRTAKENQSQKNVRLHDFSKLSNIHQSSEFRQIVNEKVLISDRFALFSKPYFK